MSALPLTSVQTQTAVRFSAFGAPDVLEVVGLEVPEPGPGEVRTRVQASSVQFTDTLIRRKLYPDLRGKPPFVPGYDLVGVVDAIGPDVTEVQPGDRVADLTMLGGNARYAIRPAAGLVPVPDSVDAAEATTLVLSWLTAQQALFRRGNLKAGERLLVIGGNGSVGLAAVRLAVLAGAEVYATASDRHHDAVRAAGATPLPREGWQPILSELGGVDVVLDGIAADGFVSTYRALRNGGRLVAIGVSAAAAKASMLRAIPGFLRVTVLWRLIPSRRTASFYSITSVRSEHPDWFRQDLAALFARLQQREIQPLVAERLALDDVADAHARLEAGGLSGKLVVLPWA